MTASLLLLIAGCGAEKNETAEGSSDGTAAVSQTDPATDSVSSSPGETDSTTVEPTGGSTTEAEEGSTINPTTNPSEPTSAGTTFESESDTATDTAEPPPPLPDPTAPCTTLCEHKIECDLERDLQACIDACLDEFGGSTPMCIETFESEVACSESLACEDLFVALDPNTFDGPCQSFDGSQECAQPANCGRGGGGGPGQCEWQVNCEGKPDRIMNCDDTTCVCRVGDEKTGECPADGICDVDVENLDLKAMECCGF